MEVITILLAIAIVFIYIQNYKIKKDVKGLKTLIKILYKDNYKNDHEIRSLYNLIALKHKEITDNLDKKKYKRSDMKPPPSPEKIDVKTLIKNNTIYSEDQIYEITKELEKITNYIETKNNNK